MRLFSPSLRRRSGSRRTPANSSASVTEVIATSSVRDSIQFTTRGSGEGRKISELTFVSRTITRSPRPPPLQAVLECSLPGLRCDICESPAYRYPGCMCARERSGPSGTTIRDLVRFTLLVIGDPFAYGLAGVEMP